MLKDVTKWVDSLTASRRLNVSQNIWKTAQKVPKIRQLQSNILEYSFIDAASATSEIFVSDSRCDVDDDRPDKKTTKATTKSPKQQKSRK